VSHEGIAWKIKVKSGDKEIEVIGLTPEMVKKWFDELEQKYMKAGHGKVALGKVE
jgi:hypothetical protein